MEITLRMCKRFTWLHAVIVLVSIGFLVACGSHYSSNSSSNGLVIVPSQGSQVIQAFGITLSNGRVSQINTSPASLGLPTAIILDPAGTYAYVIVVPASAVANSVKAASVASYKINSDGTLSAAGMPVALSAPLGSVSPVAITVDSSGKFLFVADQATTSGTTGVAGTVSVFSIGSGGSVTEVAGSPFAVPVTQGGAGANLVAVAVTPTSFPSANAVCSKQTPPTTEYLYAADASTNQVWEFQVNTSSGTLGPPAPSTSVVGFAAGSLPSGVAVDPCNRFVYVANQISNDVRAYTISPTDGSLISVGPATSAGNGPGPIAIDPLGNFLYVVDKLSNQISAYRISAAQGTLTPLSPATVTTGTTPVSIAIRSDDTWLFVANYNSASISQYAVTPATGVLNPTATAIATDNFPLGVAVK
jgi:6-phosphogluconolactonase (cycloisomerase 2 family)